MSEKLKQKFQGALLGTFVGDALGMPVEGWSPGAISERLGDVRDMLDARLGKGTYTDDTQMMIGIAESLIECGDLNGEHLALRFLDNFDPSRGYGGGTVQALSLIEQGVPWDAVGKQIFQGGSFGNGSSMRIAPVGVFYYDDPYVLREKAYLSSQITHAHPLGKESAALQAFAIARATLADPTEELDVHAFLGDLIAFVEPEAEELIRNLYKLESFLIDTPTIDHVVSSMGNDVRSYVSVPAAIYAFLNKHHSFEEAVVFGVSLGGDTDTIGAMTGAIAGAYHGIDRVPSRWLTDLENGAKGKDYVSDLASQLYEIKVTTL